MSPLVIGALVTAGLAIGASAGASLSAGSETAAKQEVPSRLVVRGELRRVVFCEGEDGELWIERNQFKIVCADRHKTPLTVTATTATIGNMILGCEQWCAQVLSVPGAPDGKTSTVNMTGMITLESGGINVP